MDSTLNEFVAELAAMYNKDFDHAFKKQLEVSIIGFRASLLKQEADKNGRFPTASIDSFKLKLKSVPAAECCLDENSECTILRTIDRVPNPVRTNRNAEPFDFIGTSDFRVAFTYIKPEDYNYIVEGTKFMSNAMFYMYYDDFVYTINNENGKAGFRGAIANPTELLTLKNCDGKPCKEEIYLEEDLKKTIRQMIIEDFTRIRILSPEKEINLNES